MDDVIGETIVLDETKLGKYQVSVKTSSSTFLVDEPLAAGGLGSGPNPYDLLSAALGSCSLMTMRLYADRRKWPLENVRVKVTHHRKGPQGRDLFVREIQLTGPLDEAQKQKIHEISLRCPVHLTLTRGADVETVVLPSAPMPAASMEDKATTLCEHMRDMNEICK